MTSCQARLIVIAIFATAFSAPISAQQETVAELQAKAEQGDVEAQRGLGFLYAVGGGVPQDVAAAARWYELAANQGDRFSQTNLGYMYFEGRGVPQDEVAAVRWFELAANQGNPSAQSMLGFIHFRGQGVSQDYAVAARWFELAANQGQADAQGRLGAMYFNGQGVPQDYVTAYMWFYLAASRLSDADLRDLAVKGRARAATQLTPNQLAEAQRLAREWEARDVTPSGVGQQESIEELRAAAAPGGRKTYQE